MEKYLDENLSLGKRKIEFEKYMDKVMNPDKSFNSETFDPMKGLPEWNVGKRQRIKIEGELPTQNMNPKKIRTGQMIGMYESKQDLYLTFANKCNELEKRIKALENK